MFGRLVFILIIILVVIVVFRNLKRITPANFKETNNSGSQRLKDYYQILQVHPTAEQEVIKAAYEKLAKKYHPDVNPIRSSLKRMKDLNEAFEVLGSSSRRRAYHQQWLQRRKDRSNS